MRRESQATPTALQRRQVRERAGGRCEYCRHPDSHSNAPYEVDHIQPIAHRGLTILINLAYACGGCNNRKRDRQTAIDPLTDRTVDLFHPRNDRWRDHFGWSENSLEIVGLTPVGRATAVALELNRPGLINLRTLLLAAGLHPGED